MNEIAEIINGTLHSGIPVEITEYSIDSRSVVTPEHTLFFALTGNNHNGHDYIRTLYTDGVRAFVISEFREEFNQLTGANFIVVENVLTALQQLAAHHRQHTQAEVIGITGSNGKTVVKEWLYQLLANDHAVYRSPRSYNSQVGVPLSLLGIDPKTEIAIIEAGISQKGEMQHLQQMIQPTIGIFTHLGDAHGENFASREEKLAEKAQLFTSCQWVIGQTGEALEYIKTRVPSTTSFLLWGEDPKADIHVKTMNIALGHREVQVTFGNKHFILDIPFPDIASYENCMNAVSILLLKQYSPDVITSRVQQLSAIAMRMEIKDGINNCTLVNDYYNSDPSSFQLALNILATQDASKERVVILSDFMDTGKAGDDLYPSIAETLRQANISLFIGIGKHLSEHRHDFSANSRFYEDTEHFLRQEERDNFNNQIILIKGARAFQFEYIAGFLQKQSHSTILEVDLDAMVHNLNHFRSLTDAHIAVMVKAFSYGSGSREIASLLQYHRVDYLMVAFADEGIELRAAGITIPIAVMNPEREAFDNMIMFNLEPEIYALDILEDFNRALNKHGIKRFPVHIKLNTGMNRSGFDEQDLPQLLEFFQTERSVYIRSMFSHLAGSDETVHDEFTLGQIHLFERMTERIQAQFNYKIWRHILNSAGIERFPQYHFDMVRLGIGLHGISATHANLQPVSSFKTYISSIRNVPTDQSIGYGRKSYTTRPSRIAVIPVGYADGLNRHLSNRVGNVFIKGKRVPIIGNICMDTCMIDVTDTNATIGDEVEIFGKHILVTELSEQLGTIPYEILTGISHRVKRVYYKE
ncbi:MULTISPECIES: bifunctional UDP-N-acetylmuramoyl-tripeptide:D-alanyl-D-alanine ligase/alanine racemase [Butyricimonas]|jgi:alanine racemase|uniref:Alanine racemase n=1 Tax=Butyricimonas faecihominis TaxID=1472416 RepID=A0A7W6MXU9_9BACT|nr:MULTISPECIES: bifunctional UDP-N-acetylmuramoyl-tripeptide:D-alanyl-D-alanine ligase/alanine racemase [Butyricimonas]MBS6687361.1 bifunctional UDP-N-acetylmuramoyl-tripeptide:D-alanyl-D-alanine ligase/alanine racemase [Sanguibacteroides justesenii]KAB1505100.1 bifunctional UDP-N-acetylmuramoyl-tripeptide:D-alanyl-D-alanine ligase/alanine racemase [Butyricimonas faecihominis]MBB4025175.1 alanine racemase [Butyricimonas faecihominis]WOF07097.1 bifunctional UDP-N-acetylmuramoyl-tripeptide:D-ala